MRRDYSPNERRLSPRPADATIRDDVNEFSWIILGALLLEYGLDLAANLLNLRALRYDVPPELKGVYDPADYRRSQEYTRVSTRFGFIVSTFTLAVVLAFWFSHGFGFLDQVLRGWGLPYVVTGLVYIGILLGGYMLVTLPFSVYGTFVIEQRFGFNRTTPRTFIADRIKSLALAAVLGGALLTALLLLFQYAGTFAWLYVWAAVIIFMLAVQYIAPNWIMPLFNKFTPMPDGELRQAILSYARSVDFPLKNIYVMDGSKRSTRSNAFFTGFGRNKRIALFDTLIAQNTVAEMVAVLAHEVGHYKKKHITIGMVISIVHLGLVLYLLSLFLDSPGLYRAFYVDQPSVYAGLIFFSLLYTPLEMVLSIVMQAISRRNEAEADRFAAETYDPASLAEALRKLSRSNLSNLTPHPFLVFLTYSHPPVLARVRALEHGAAKSP